MLFWELLLITPPVILAAVFHMLVVKKNWFSALSYPLDHGQSFRGKRIFGDNKTYRGIVVMLIASIFFTYLHELWISNSVQLQSYNLLDFESYNFIFYGLLFGLGYVLGELPNSFVKRQAGIAAGKSPGLLSRIVDQLDSITLIMFLLVIFSDFSWTHFVLGIFFFGFLHLGINYLLYQIGLRKEPF